MWGSGFAGRSFSEVFGGYMVGILVHGTAFKICIEGWWDMLQCQVIRLCTITI
jgi:hypothetical protein